MKLAFIYFFLLVTIISCNTETSPKIALVIKNTDSKNYQQEIKKIQLFAKNNNYNQKIAFMIDYSLHSGKNRFFVVDLKNTKVIDTGLVCHGSCKGDNENNYAKKFNNIPNSYCTSLGMASVGKRANSSWGKKYKYWLHGLEKTNNNMKKRVVVLHAWKGVPDDAIYPNSLALSWGCPTVSIAFLDKLDLLLKKEKKILLYSFN